MISVGTGSTDKCGSKAEVKMMNANKTTFIDTNSLPRLKTEQGELTEILNPELAGAENVLCSIRWLKAGEQFAPQVTDKHQLI